MNENNTRLKIARRRLPALLVLCALLLTAVFFLPALAQETPDATVGEPSPASAAVVAADPDFSTIDDPLNGDYELFTVDDLIIARTKPANNNTRSFVYNYILETENNTITSQSAQSPDSPQCYLTSGRQPQQTRVGRFFDLPYDVIVTLLPNGVTASGSNCSAPVGEPNMSLHIQSPNFAGNIPVAFAMSAANTAVAMDDFNQDGFEDLFIMSNAEMMVAAANDVTDVNAGMQLGAKTAHTGGAERDPVTGDFNADGILDVAWLGNGQINFASVCPDSVANTICSGKQPLDVVLLAGTVGGFSSPRTLAAGRFGNYDGSGLMVFDLQGVTDSNGLASYNYNAIWYQFNNDWSLVGGAPIRSKVIENYINYNDNGNLAIATRLDWFGAYDQVVYAHDVVAYPSQNCCALSYLIVHVLDFNAGQNDFTDYNTGYIDAHSTGYTFPPSPPWLNGLAVGRLASIGSNTTDDSAYNPQIVVLRNDGVLHILGVDPQNANYTPTSLSTVPVDPALALNLVPTAGLGGTQVPTGLNWLQAGDLQGRSARLGPPSVFRMASHSQPSVILGAPPMHVDYIQPDSSTGADWEIVNFSAVPDTYNSSYAMSQTSTNQSADTSKTSYTYTSAENSESKFNLKPPYAPSISGSLKKTTSDKSETVSENYSFKQDEFKYNASATTGFGDEIWYDESAFNMYLYRVLGETVCPSDIPNCTANQELPLYVMFSGPSSAGTGPAPGETTEWYQPVHEPGNLFSYPWNQTMLAQEIEGGIDLLTGPQHFFTDDSTQSQNLTWSNSSGQSQTAGTTNNHSYEKAYSLTAGKIIGKVVNADLKGDLDYSESSSSSSLNKSSSSLGSSQGIEIDKAGSFRTPGLYQYRVEPYIFGRPAPAGTVDDASLTEDIQTYGPLQAAYAANPLDPQAGSWWGSDTSPYSQFIDVALNHPVRWNKTNPSGTQDSLNCLEAGGRNNCMLFNDPDPSNLWNSQFYWMRGLFVTVDGVNGPQRNQATAGDQVTLQARVYNYSLMDMPAGSTIQTRFYRQPMSGTTPVGNSVLISQVSTGPLPGFNSETSPNTPNWKVVTTSLDTTGLDNTYQIFWVLVWVEDGSGNMIAELPGHGLSAKPGSLTTIADVPLEEVTLDGAAKTFSNNVGYLHSKFYIAPQATQAPPTTDPVLSIDNMQINPATPGPGERVIVSAEIFSVDAPADAVHVRLFPSAAAWHAHREDPSRPQPKPFDVELLPFIANGKSDQLEVPYQTNMCGKQEILIVAEAAGAEEVTTATAMYDNGPCLVYYPVMPIQSLK
jgi:hypothetical protein